MIPFSESALSLRRRSVWEALDSGILLWRNNFFYFIPFFALPVWICAFYLRFLPGNFFYLSYIVLWWLKPLFDRLLLHVVSRRFFNAASSVRLRDFYRGIWKTLFRGLLGDLLWRRFNPGRAALMPIRVLEEAGGKQFRERKNALAVGGLGFSPFVGILGIAMELLLLAGEILFAVVIVQMFMPSAFSYRSNYMPAMEIYVFCAYCLNFIFVESLYICMSFGLYINSRVEVEGWDLQLLFQKFTGSGSRSKIHRPAGNAVFLICLFLLLSPAVHVSSEESPGGITDELSEKAAEEPVLVSNSIKFFPENFPSVNDDSSDHLKEILASKDFGAEKEGWGIRLKDQKQQGQLPDIAIAPWMEKLRQVFGFVLRAFVVLVLAGFAGFVMYWFFKNYRRTSRSRERYRNRRESRAGSPVLAESP
ncbi:MAG: hypothetical protein FWF26_00670, partial [Treponema sp.]|nr:hypothetical protein [Treponema sp.]